MKKEQINEFLNLIAEGVPRTDAVKELELPLPDLQKEIDSNQSFKQRLLELETSMVVENLYVAAISGNVQACIKWLELTQGTKEVKSESTTTSKLPREPPPFFNDTEREKWKLLGNAKRRSLEEKNQGEPQK